MARPKTNKAEFIRRFPNLKASQVVEHGKKAGIKLSTNYVYMVRSGSGAKAKTTAGAPNGGGRAARSGGLESAIARLAQDFARSVLALVRNATVGDIAG